MSSPCKTCKRIHENDITILSFGLCYFVNSVLLFLQPSQQSQCLNKSQLNEQNIWQEGYKLKMFQPQRLSQLRRLKVKMVQNYWANPQGFINWDLSEEAGHIKADQSVLRCDPDLLDSLSKDWSSSQCTCAVCVLSGGGVKIRDSSFTRLYKGEPMAETIGLIGHPTLLIFGKPVHLGSIEYLGVSQSWRLFIYVPFTDLLPKEAFTVFFCDVSGFLQLHRQAKFQSIGDEPVKATSGKKHQMIAASGNFSLWFFSR